MEYYSISEKSTKREINEDNFLILETNDEYIFAIADGMGGLPFGDIASKIAIETLQKQCNEDSSLANDFETINNTILEEGNKKQVQMGSTLVVLKINRNTRNIQVAQIGDSRAYIINKFFWRTKDDSYVQDLIDRGMLEKDQAFGHPYKHILTKALGIQKKISINIYNTLMDKGIILLSSDGLHDYVKDDDIQKIVKKCPLKLVCNELFKQARLNGSNDDVTIIIVQL